MSIACTECGAPHEVGFVVCKYCGFPYSEEAMQGAVPCHKCATPNLRDAVKCVACGNPIGPMHAGPPVNAGGDTHLGPITTHRRHGHTSRRTVVTFLGGRLVFSTGEPMQISVAEIQDVRTEGSFNGEKYFGSPWIIVRTSSDEHGFMVKQGQEAQWLQALAPRKS